MYAVFETGGKQYRATEGDVVFIERLGGEAGDEVIFEKILACSSEAETDFGNPYLKDSSVAAKILGHGKNKKIVIFKYKAKKGYRKKQGHRQPYTKIRIERIVSGKFGEASYVATDEADEVDEVVEVAEVDGGIEAGRVVEMDDDDAEDVDDDADDADDLDGDLDGDIDDEADEDADDDIDDETDFVDDDIDDDADFADDDADDDDD